ncbi:hypothetical protein F2Q70_00032088 [Brassica cretica]|uniref:indole-3-glycerol-phosphate synthase n=1 Tax=Brassica cretica TaxID=69181 RepID=A0A8S9FMY3_BRACR|nr:hypothetical protein F2Q70_00032088 [Brassica cretica]
MVAIAQAYEKGGAACLSVLTDEKYFKGSFENLQAIREAGVKCPLLCKEFIIEAWQIYYGRTKGADAVLLIASVLPDLDIKYMIKICKILGMATLVEVHDEREMDRVLAIEGVELIGINNRNLETFEVDIGITKRLLEGERGELIRQKDILVVGESGLFTPEDIAFVQEAGVKAVLVGESLVKQSDPGQVSEQEVVIYQDEVVASQGIRIRRRPPTGPPLHYVGPFEFRLQNEGNTPRNILEEIVWNKDKEVTLMKEKRPLYTLKKALETVPPPRDFIGALRSAHQRTGLPGLIAEVKKASPSRGILREDFDPVAIAQAYEKGGAACLSVLTDEKYFKGSFENLQAIREAGVKCPLLCKEFIIEAWQIYYGRSKGADAVLLIASVLPDLDIKYMIKICKILGMATLVEVHDEREMDRVLAIEGVELIGINNRNLETFEVDIGITKRLLEGERGELIRQKDILVVGESGLFTPEDIAFVQEAGVKAVLVGESLVKQSDPGQGISALFGRDVSG